MFSTGIFLKIKFSKFLQTHFSSPIPIRIEKKNTPPGVVCHGLQENAFQVNQLYNVIWVVIICKIKVKPAYKSCDPL